MLFNVNNEEDSIETNYIIYVIYFKIQKVFQSCCLPYKGGFENVYPAAIKCALSIIPNIAPLRCYFFLADGHSCT